MRAGKHVYCEKPLTHSVWEARQVATVARERKLALHSHSDADAVERQFKQDPGARILWAHSGFERPEKVREMLRKHRNLWCDLAFRNDHGAGGKVHLDLGDEDALELARTVAAKAPLAMPKNASTGRHYSGINILILSDRGIDYANAAIPSLLAVSGLHHHLIRTGLYPQAKDKIIVLGLAAAFSPGRKAV